MTVEENDILQKAKTLADYSALVKLAEALWQQNGSYHGAAIMVGAGFSRSSAKTGDTSKSIPLWMDLSRKLAEDLDPNDKNLQFSDPLRLAEEYRAHFGQHALNDMIKRTINDSSWTPGRLHDSLLSLPWTEILTTNWDTLLERASQENHHRIYNIVSKQSDLSYSRSPRITKLHGTINTTEELIFTQDDYRRYPETHAAFVNFARQVFIENELCLLGFSGDDPNFLKWAGWVRDHLSKNARRIYLVGALNLTTAKRKYFDSINVAAIDLSDLVQEYDDPNLKHVKATELFFSILNDLKPRMPWEWSPSAINREMPIEDFILTLEKDRCSYPGWLVCPHSLRWQIKSQLSIHHINKNSLSTLPQTQKEKLLYEISWRHRIAFEIEHDWIYYEFLSICDPSKPCSLTKKQQLEIALSTLSASRWLSNNSTSQELTTITKNIIQSNSIHWPEAINEVCYHDAIIARDNLNYTKLEELLEGISGEDPIWKMRKATLLAEVGRFKEGENLLNEAFQELLIQHRNDNKSIHIYSRLSWVQLVLKAVRYWTQSRSTESLPTIQSQWMCDPWDHIDHIKYRIDKEVDKQINKNQIQPLFGAGTYKDNSNTISLNNETHLLLLLDGITRVTGLPIRWDETSFLNSHIEKLSTLEIIDNSERFTLSVRSANSDSARIITNTFSRINLARASFDDIQKILEECKAAIAYWRKKLESKDTTQRHFYIDRLRVFIEVLSRVIVRATPQVASEAFILATEIGEEKYATHMWLYSPLKNLLRYSLESIPASNHHLLLLDALKFPMPTEKTGNSWPNPVIRYPGVRMENNEIDYRISQIIRSISSNAISSKNITSNDDYSNEPSSLIKETSLNMAALSRLLPLVKCNFTKETENNLIAEQIYGKDYQWKNLPLSNFFPHVFADLPSTDPQKTIELIQLSLFKDECAINQIDLEAKISASWDSEGRFLPSAEQAAKYFDHLIKWRPQNENSSIFEFKKNENTILIKLVSEAISRSIVPALSSKDLTLERFNQLQLFWKELDSAPLAMSFPYFTPLGEAALTIIEREIRGALQDRDPDKVAYAAFAISKWRKTSNSTKVRNLISRSLYLIESGRTIGLVALLGAINELLKSGLLSEDDTALLIEIIPKVFYESEYSLVAINSRDTASISLVRAECVRLARNMCDLDLQCYPEIEKMLKTAENDPLPEVRFSETATI